jgi:hypothetical protein
MDNCTQTTNFCLSCNGQGGWKGYNNAKFPQSDASYNSYQSNGNPCGCGGIGGINNSKNFRTSASSFTILKKSLTTFNPISSSPAKSTIGKDAKTGTPLTSYTNVGGPGDATASVPIRTGTASGIKARTIVQPHQTGVDVKHGSYERYLARKRGINMRCQSC